MRNGPFVSDKALLIRVTKIFFQSSMTLEGARERKNNFRSQISEYSKLRETKTRGWLQHRLQLGIPIPCEAGRTVDQVPKLGEWSHKLESRKNLRKKKEKGERSFRLITEKLSELRCFFRI